MEKSIIIIVIMIIWLISIAIRYFLLERKYKKNLENLDSFDLAMLKDDREPQYNLKNHYPEYYEKLKKRLNMSDSQNADD
jgi:hypothetical protein